MFFLILRWTFEAKPSAPVRPASRRVLVEALFPDRRQQTIKGDRLPHMPLILILVILLLLFGGGGYYMGPGVGYYGGGGLSLVLLIVILFLLFGRGRNRL
jgi:hypothetical protein